MHEAKLCRSLVQKVGSQSLVILWTVSYNVHCPYAVLTNDSNGLLAHCGKFHFIIHLRNTKKICLNKKFSIFPFKKEM